MTYCTSNPHRDAERYMDEQEAAAEYYERKEVEVAADIMNLFMTFSPVPYASYSGMSSPKLRYQPFDEALQAVWGYDDVDAALMDMLKTSECPKVKAFLATAAKRYAYLNAADIAGVA